MNLDELKKASPEATFQTFIDKEGWPKGEWLKEPDRIFWVDKKTKYPCIILRRENHGALCGYVGVPETHPYFKKEYHEIENINVHGDLTFSDECSENELGVCHPGYEKVWWLGFDCLHSGDYAPAYSQKSTLLDNLIIGFCQELPTYGTYRNIIYVQKECQKLAKQLKKVKRDSR